MNLSDYVSKMDLSVKLNARLKAGELSHAYLFVSPDEILRKEFCLNLCEQILGDKSQVKAGSHPDFKAIMASKIINVESVNEIVSDVYLTPLEAEYKVYLIDDASLMTEEAQNKLLKTIEEPPKRVVIILGASQTNSILPTILSRVLKFDLPKISQEDLIYLTDNCNLTPSELSLFASSADGNITRLNELMEDEDFMSLYNLAFEAFKINSSKEIIKVLSKINLAKISLLTFFSLTNSIARDIMMVLSNSRNLVNNKSRLDEIVLLSKEFNLLSITKIINETNKFTQDLSFNANNQSVLDEFMLKLVEVKVTCKK